MNTAEPSNPSPVSHESIGSVLTTKRNERVLSVADVAARLNLSVDTIKALEAGDYTNLPGSTFVKGYIRAYAKLLQLQVEDLIANIHLQPDPITEIPTDRATLKRKGKIKPDDRNFLRYFAWDKFVEVILAFVVLAGLAIFGLSQLPEFGINNISALIQSIRQKQTPVESNQVVIPADAATNNAQAEQ